MRSAESAVTANFSFMDTPPKPSQLPGAVWHLSMAASNHGNRLESRGEILARADQATIF
jgi:hypothetical protein